MNQHSGTVSRRTIGKAAIGAAVGTAALGKASSVFAAPTYLRLQSNPVEIVFAHIWGVKPGDEAPEKKHPVDQVIDAFNAHGTGVTVVSRTDTGNYQSTLAKVQAEMAAGNAPALVTTPWSNIEMAIEGLGVNNLDDIAGDQLNEVLGSLREEVIPLVQQDGKTFGVPFAFSSPVMYYNVDLFTQAGLDKETVFADWTSFAAALPTLKDLVGNEVFATFVNHDWPAQALIQCNGGSIYDEEGNLAIDSPEAIEAMHTWADFSAEGYYFKSLIAEVRPAFVAGTLPMATGSVASLGGLRNSVEFELGTASYPVYPGKPRKMPSGGSFIGCYAREDEQKQAAWEFLKFVVTDEAAQIWSQTGYLNATTWDVPVLPGQEAAIAHLEEGLTRETSWPGARSSEMQTTWGSYVERIWLGDVSVEEGVEMAKQELESIAG